MKPVLEIIDRAATYLEGYGIPRARRAAEDVVAQALGCRRIDLYLQFERPLVEEELEKCRAALKRRSQREPIEYIAGEVEFAGVTLKVTPAVLIPRPETEILVEKIAQTATEGVLFDVCCGSGAIGIALKKRCPNLEVYLSDISEEALEVARANAAQADVAVTFLQGNLLAPFVDKTCDFFVCNPPYVADHEYNTLCPEVKWEPKRALVAAEGGLLFYRRLAHELKGRIRKQGWLEIGSGRGAAVKNIFTKEGWECHYECDWAGHDRFFFLKALA